MRGPHFNPFLGGRGFANLAASVGNFSVVALFNNGAPDYVLRLWDAQTSIPGAQFFLFAMQRGSVGVLLANSIFPYVFEEKAPIGQIFSQQPAASPIVNPQGLLAQTNTVAYSWAHDFPIAVLQPGTSFVIATPAVNIQLQVSLTWDVVAYGDLLEHFA